MDAMYVAAGVWLLLSAIMVPLARRAAWRFQRPMSSDEIACARRKSEAGICYDCDGPILGRRAEKRLFDRCQRCDSNA